MFCDYKKCQSTAEYYIEWWGLNQHGQNPHIADEVHACINPRHIINLSQHEDFGGYPDEIYSVRNNEDYEVKPELLSLIKKAIDGDLKPGTIDNIIQIADPPKEQLKLFQEANHI